MAVSIQSRIARAFGLALGNVEGYNICNVLFVSGASALIVRRTIVNDGSLLASSSELPD